MRGNWQDFNWHDASRGPSARTELLVHYNRVTLIFLFIFFISDCCLLLSYSVAVSLLLTVMAIIFSPMTPKENRRFDSADQLNAVMKCYCLCSIHEITIIQCKCTMYNRGLINNFTRWFCQTDQYLILHDKIPDITISIYFLVSTNYTYCNQ